MTVTSPWLYVSESRSATTPAPPKAPRPDRRSKLVSVFLFAHLFLPHCLQIFFAVIISSSSQAHSTQMSQINNEICYALGAMSNRFIRTDYTTFCQLLLLLFFNLWVHPWACLLSNTTLDKERII